MPKKKILLLLIPALLLAGFLFWSRPISFWKLTGADRAGVRSLSATTVTGGVNSGVPYHDSWQLESTPAEDPVVLEFFDLMASCSYVPSPVNLLPWDIHSVSAGEKIYGDHTVHIAFTWGETGEHHAFVSYLGGKKLALSLPDEDGYLVYRPVDKDLADRLGEFIEEHGIPS